MAAQRKTYGLADILSLAQAGTGQDWLRAEALLANGEALTGTVSAVNRAGLIVPFGHLRGFVPLREMTPFPPVHPGRLPDWVGVELRLVVVEADRRRRRLVFSQRRAVPAAKR